MREITESGFSLIKRFEGFSATPYFCPAGYRTIGYGHVLRPGDPELVDESQALQMLEIDVQTAQRSVLRLIAVPLADNQFDAMVDFTLNLGGGALQRSTLRRKINRGDDPIPEFGKWVYGGGQKQPGLVRRRAAEAKLYGGNFS